MALTGVLAWLVALGTAAAQAERVPGAARFVGRYAEALLSRGRQHSPSAFERGDAADHGACGGGRDSGTGDWGFAEVLKK